MASISYGYLQLDAVGYGHNAQSAVAPYKHNGNDWMCLIVPGVPWFFCGWIE